MNKSFVLIASLFFILSCSKKKELVPTVQVSELSSAQVIQKLRAQNRSYDWLQMTGKIKFNTEENKFSGGILIRAKQDSVVWARIKKLGIEGARIYSDSESLTVLNRIDKQVIQNSFDQINKDSGVEFGLKQLGDILSAQAYLPEGVMFSVRIDSQHYVLSAKHLDRDVVHRVRAYDFQLSESSIRDEQGRGIHAAYSNYEYAPDSLSKWPSQRVYTLSDDNQDTRIELSIKELKLQGPFNMPFSIPPHYERVQ